MEEMDLVCVTNNFIKNPQKMPLNKLYLEYEDINKTSKTGTPVAEMLKRIEKPTDKYCSNYTIKIERKPAIDKCWINHVRKYATFQPFYAQFDENSLFLEKNENFLECIQFFVKCTFQQFWCYVSYEPRFAKMVIDFLENAVSHCAVKYLSTKHLSLYNEIHASICKIYQRLINFSVSEVEYIEEAAAVKYLRKSNLITSYAIMNFCYLFEHKYKGFVDKLANFCFSSKFEDVYVSELTELLDEVFDSLYQISVRSKLSVFNPVYVEETAYYLLEAAQSLSTFISVCKPAISIAIEQQLVHRLPHIYQKVYLDLYDMCDMKSDVGYDLSKLEKLIKDWLALGRQYFIEFSHHFIEYCLYHIVQLRNQEHKQQEYLQIYLALISIALDDDLFIRDYNEIHPIKEQFKLLQDNILNFDKSQTDYLFHSLCAITASASESKTSVVTSIKGRRLSSAEPFPLDLYKSIYTTLNQAVPGFNQQENVLSAIKKYEQLRKQWEVNANCWIIETMPDVSLEDDFEDWQELNSLSDNEISDRIAAVKEMLPHLNDDYILQKLKCVDYRPELVISHVLDEGNLTSSKLVKMVSYVGKKPQHNDAKDLLDDITDDLKNLVLKASHNYEVDDDYDDRNEIYNNFEPDKDDSKMYRHLKQNNLMYNVISDPSSSEGEDETSADVKPRDAFCEDPAVIRARRSAQRGRVFKQSSQKADVVGRPKGQGQEHNVQRDRDKKNVHKDKWANHNRKGSAHWKRNKGMLPS